MAFIGTLHVFLCLLLPGLIGYAGIRILYRVFPSEEPLQIEDWNLSVLYVLGLLYWLLAAFALQCLGAPWLIATYLPCLLLVADRKSLDCIPELLQPERTPNFLIWFFIIVSIGISLCTVSKGIDTSWVNNYGDLTFHLGIISSMVFGHNIPPEYHIYSGENLSYPFFMNYWTALLWWPFPDWRLLGVIFTLQWTVLWVLVYRLLSASRNVVLPWVLLFGGGSYFLLGEMSTDHLNKGFPWTVFISTIWVPQRTFVLGAVCILTVLQIAFKGFRKDSSHTRVLFESTSAEQRLRMGVIGFTIAVTFICHGHSALVLSLFLLLAFVGKLVRHHFGNRVRSQVHSPFIDPTALFVFFLVLISLGICLSPWLIGKSGIVQPIAGWTGGDTTAVGFERIQEMLRMWSKNFGQGLFLFLPLFLFSAYRSEAVACVALFLLFNFVQIAAWKWDQVKVFIALYVILVGLWSQTNKRSLLYMQFLLLVLMVPGVVECFYLFQKGPRFEVYGNDKLKQANVLRKETPPGSVIAAAPEHHSAVTLSGRSMFMGYPGTLWSHSLKYGERERINKSLTELVACKAKRPESMPCPSYLLWDAHAKKYWGREKPDTPGLKLVHRPFLYRIQSNG